MTEYLDFDGHNVQIQRRAYKSRMTVHVYPNGEIRVRTNRTTSQRAILDFLSKNKTWLWDSVGHAREIQQKFPPKKLQSGENYPLLGSQYELVVSAGDKRQIQFLNKKIIFQAPAHQLATEEGRKQCLLLLKNTYKQVAEDLMRERLVYWSRIMNLHPTGLKFGTQKSFWGSCTSKNVIRLNYKLIAAPAQVIDYVIIHELAHILHKNHSPKFWDLVEKFTPDKKYSGRWLKENLYIADFLANRSDLDKPIET